MKKVRQSNIELYRIVLMLIIIAHHYVVNSGIPKEYNYANVDLQTLWLVVFGGGG